MPAASTIYDEKQKVTIAGIKKNAFYVVKHENARVKYPLRKRPFQKGWFLQYQNVLFDVRGVALYSL
jgi:hypothetical protein